MFPASPLHRSDALLKVLSAAPRMGLRSERSLKGKSGAFRLHKALQLKNVTSTISREALCGPFMSYCILMQDAFVSIIRSYSGSPDFGFEPLQYCVMERELTGSCQSQCFSQPHFAEF